MPDTLGRLFLLKPNFYDNGQGPFFCPESAQIRGLLEFYPELRTRFDVRFLDFPRPREELVELLGTEHQTCPRLVLDSIPPDLSQCPELQISNGHAFVDGAEALSNYFARICGTGRPH